MCRSIDEIQARAARRTACFEPTARFIDRYQGDACPLPNTMQDTVLRQIIPTRLEDTFMAEHTYKTIELTGSSKTSIEEAVNNAITKASKTIHNLRWCEVTNVRGYIEEGSLSYWQVSMKVSFTLDE
jgi:flavin-binding protein dodecin